jgi:predicted CXXCH cytochrome family protein
VRCSIKYLTSRPNGSVSVKTTHVDAMELRCGRGTDSELYLPDLRVAYHHAVLRDVDGQWIIEAVGEAMLRVGNQPVQRALLQKGEAVEVGPYVVELADGEAGDDFELKVELKVPVPDTTVLLKGRGGMVLADAMLSKRSLSWALALLVVALFLALPIAAFFSPPVHEISKLAPIAFDKSWDSGELSNPHKMLSGNCENCHDKAFTMVRDETCLTCHADQHNHADPSMFELAGLTETRCATCHKEHNGPSPIVQQDRSLCASCHRDLNSKTAQTKLVNVASWAPGHPQFRPTIVTDAGAGKIERLALDKDAWPKEGSGLKFSHAAHMVERDFGTGLPVLDGAGQMIPIKLRSPTRGMIQLDCGNCHKPGPGGRGLEPLNMESLCSDCHTLKFDAAAPTRQLPHGQPAEVNAMLRDFYAGVALRGGYEGDDGAPAVVRRRPGTPLAEDQRAEALAWAEDRAARTLKTVFGRSTCGFCHEVRAPEENGTPDWQVLPVRVAGVWMPKAVFSHDAHTATPCEDCHAARGSASATDVLLPQVESCTTCHGDQDATAQVPSPCAMCHIYHQDEGPLMGQPTKKTAALPWDGAAVRVAWVR